MIKSNRVFPEYKRKESEITVRHLLTMTAPYPFVDWQEPLEELCTQPDWVQYTLHRMGNGGEIGTFKYSSAGAHVLSAIITSATGKVRVNLRMNSYFSHST